PRPAGTRPRTWTAARSPIGRAVGMRGSVEPARSAPASKSPPGRQPPRRPGAGHEEGDVPGPDLFLPNRAIVQADAGIVSSAAGRDLPRGVRRIAAAPPLGRSRSVARTRLARYCRCAVYETAVG